MTLNEIRKAYLDFFKARGHAIVPSASLVPENDPTTLFTGSGMQPMVPYLLGEVHPMGTRIADSQKSFRAVDIEEVGDNRHTTFFEMLGNWSLGDYFKKEQLPWVFELLIDELGLDPERLYVTVFIGDEAQKLPKDTESAGIWKDLFASKGIEAHEAEMGSEAQGYVRGMKEGERIFYYDAAKNWWSRSGTPERMPAGEPGGPDSELFYEFTDVEHDPSFGEHCHPNCDCGRFLEIGNSVFMKYVKQADGSFADLPKHNVDFGGGLERFAMALANNHDIIDVCHREIVDALETASGVSYSTPEHTASFRIIADHIRAAVFLIGDGVEPSNADQGYFVRRLLRRAITHWDKLGISEAGLSSLVLPALLPYKDAYPKTYELRDHIHAVVEAEEKKFRETLRGGLKKFEEIASDTISGKDAFMLFSTYGFPFEMTKELAAERGLSVDEEGYHAEAKKHQELSRQGAEQKFKGGLADHSDMSVKYHTTTHLLHQALRSVLGDHVQQKGSNITPERLRFDFAHGAKMTDEEKAQVEEMVNAQIKAALPVTFKDLPLSEAQELGAIGLFEEKYGDTVRVYQIGEGDQKFSLEFCGGPHVTNTSELGHFVIKKEEATSAGVRRIKAILE